MATDLWSSFKRLLVDRVLVVALDFGTTYSGYAFSFRSDFDRDPLDIQCLNVETSSSSSSSSSTSTSTSSSSSTGRCSKSLSAKVPTCVLFTPDRQFHSFGFEAEDKYADMCDSDRKEAAKWFFFDRFKMTLHKQKSLHRDLKLLDKTERKHMEALQVFSACIRHLKERAMAEVRRRTALSDREVQWVLTVPAIWDDSAKQFMREAAGRAGIEDDRLQLALEPECASVFCLRYFQNQQQSDSGQAASLSKSGKRFMTVDCGGGTVDISVFEVKAGGRLRQLHKPEGADCGGVKVDNAFKTFLSEILGFDKVTSIDNMEMLELKRNFEQSKTTMGKSDSVAIRIPSTMQEMMDITLANGNFGDRVRLVSNRLMVDNITVQTFFTEAKEGIICSMREVMQNPRVGRLDAILLVGGFSESAIIQQHVRQAFPGENVLVPPSPSDTVVKGAVQYGHCPEVISTRVAAFTYGILVYGKFNDDIHDKNKLEIIEGVRRCKDVFRVFIRINEVMEMNQESPYQTFCPVSTGVTKISITIFKSTQSSPMYTTDKGCERVGELTVEMPDLTGEMDREVHVTMSVSGTELRVRARDGNTNKEFSTSCDFLTR